MPDATITESIIFEGSSPTILARVLGNDAAAILQADYGDITFEIFKNSSTTAAVTGTVTVSTSVFDSYQTDARWSVDSTGYNFRHSPAATVFADGNASYRIEYKFAPTGEEPFWLVFLVTTVEVRSD